MPSIFRKGRTFYQRTGRVGGPVWDFTGLEKGAPLEFAGALPIWQSPASLGYSNRGQRALSGTLETHTVDPLSGRPAGTDPFQDEYRPFFDKALQEYSPRGSTSELSKGEEFLIKREFVKNSIALELMATFFERQVPDRLKENLGNTLDDLGKRAVDIAREMVAEQEGVSMGIWPPLAEDTLARKLTNLILSETGEMVEAIHYEVDRIGKTVTLVCDSERIYYSELGTAREPARPLLSPAMAMAAQELPAALGNSLDLAFLPIDLYTGKSTAQGKSHFDPFPRHMDLAQMAVAAIDAGETPPGSLPFRTPRSSNRYIYEKDESTSPRSLSQSQVDWLERMGSEYEESQVKYVGRKYFPRG